MRTEVWHDRNGTLKTFRNKKQYSTLDTVKPGWKNGRFYGLGSKLLFFPPHTGFFPRTPFFSPDKIIYFPHNQFFFFFSPRSWTWLNFLTKFQKLRPQSQPQPHLISAILQLQTPNSKLTLHDTCRFALSNSQLCLKRRNGAYDAVGMSFSTVFRRFEMRSADSIDHFIQSAFRYHVGAILS